MNIRETIYQILIDVLCNQQYANLLMRKKCNMYDIQQKQFASFMVYGVLRKYDHCLAYLKPFLSKKPSKKLEILLVFGAYQLKFSDVPSYSAINETVSLAKQGERAFVNAILRKVDQVSEDPLTKLEPLQRLACEASIPLWIANLWNKQYGFDQAVSILKSSGTQAKVFGRWNTLKIDPTTVNDPLINKIDDLGFSYDGLLHESAYYHLGQCVIQDYQSQQIVKKFTLNDNSVVLDGCAAPGSKTSQLAAMLHNTGRIDAVELHEHRCELLRQNCLRLGIENVQVIQGSLLDIELKDNDYDAILLDVPCSGLGVLNRRVEIRYHVQSDNLDQLQQLQSQLLDKVVFSLKTGGQLIYSTCTLNKKENEKQIEAFLKRHTNFSLVSQATIFPSEIDNDAFYYALMIKQ